MPVDATENGDQISIEDVEIPEGVARKVVNIIKEALSSRPRGGVIAGQPVIVGDDPSVFMPQGGGTIFSDKTNNMSDSETKPEAKSTGLMVWKGDDGQYRWLARYSNSFRDRDNPPEIISSASHKRFVKKVDCGEYPYPELWLWHQKQWKWGVATTVSFDETNPGQGFALAGGVVDKDKSWIAEKYATGEVHSLVSHGMPGHEIVRDPDDPTIYLQHQTVEISPLPPNRAANKFTGFTVFTKENDMALSTEKRQEMADNLGAPVDALREVEQSNTATGKEAVAEGAEFKEKTDAGPAEESQEVKEEYVSVKEFEKFADELVKAITETNTAFVSHIKNLTEEVKALKEEKEVAAKDLAPAASIYARLTNPHKDLSAGAPEAVKKQKPDETPEPGFQGAQSGLPFLQQMRDMNRNEVAR